MAVFPSLLILCYRLVKNVHIGGDIGSRVLGLNFAKLLGMNCVFTERSTCFSEFLGSEICVFKMSIPCQEYLYKKVNLGTLIVTFLN